MSSMTKLRRRLYRWERYVHRIQALDNSRWSSIVLPRGYWTARDAWLDEKARREQIALERFELADMGSGDIGWDADEPGCALINGQLSTCYCTERKGCPRIESDDETGWCWVCGEDDCRGECQDSCGDPACDCGGWGSCSAPEPQPVVDELAFARLGIL